MEVWVISVGVSYKKKRFWRRGLQFDHNLRNGYHGNIIMKKLAKGLPEIFLEGKFIIIRYRE